MMVEIRVGLIPGEAMEAKQWAFTRAEVDEKGVLPLVAEAQDAFTESVKHAPNTYNWVELTWIWL